MAGRQRVVRVRRNYNQWVANQTLEDYALRFTAKSARRWSSLRVANTALGAISFLALEAIGGAITLNYGFTNAALAIMVVGLIIFATGLPISYYAAKYGVDIDLLTRGAGFGYIGSTVTSLIYASFTFIFFAIEASIMSMVLEMCFGVPVWLGYILSSLVVIPLVTHGITFISWFQLWTQPVWIILHLLPFAFIAVHEWPAFHDWMQYAGHGDGALAAAKSDGRGFNLIAFGAAGSVVFSLIAQIGEQVDFLRFLPRERRGRRFAWWLSLLSAGPGWIIPGGLKLMAGSFLAYLALTHGVPFDKAAEPTQMYLIAFQYLVSSPELSLALTGVFVVISQIKINVTNAYAGSIAWSNFFSRLTHSHPGRVVWLVFNVIIALLLMELGIYKALEQILGLYSTVAVAWVGALVADLVVTKPLKLSPPHIEFKRAHLYDINPVGVGAMTIATAVSVTAFCGLLGETLQAFAPFLALVVAFISAPVIAYITRGRYYIAREPRANWAGEPAIRCCICEHKFEPEDMAFCPAYAGPICSLCCSLDARCHDSCKTEAKLSDQILSFLGKALPERIVAGLNSRVGHYLGVMFLLAWVIGGVLVMIYFQATLGGGMASTIGNTLWAVFCILMIVAGVAGWLFVLAQESRRVAQEESQRQTTLLMREIQAHKRTDAKLHSAKEAAEAANLAKSRYIVGVSHELRTPLNAILGYAQLLERDSSIPPKRRDGIRVIRRSSEHLSGLIDGLLDISKIEAGRLHLYRDEVRIHELIEQLVDMFRLHAEAKGITFVSTLPDTLPAVVYTDEKRLRQILINLLSNAIKFTDSGEVALRLRYRSQVAEVEIEDTGVGIRAEDLERIFEPFERAASAAGQARPGTGLGLTITKLLTEIMGGQISVTSEPGRGSLFRVKLLLSEVVEPERPAAAEKRIRGYSGRRLTVLVVDDDTDHRDLVYDILSPLGFNLFSAPDGGGGLSLAELCEPDLILLDISLPDMSGWDVARSLRQSGHEQTAIMMVSANALDSARERNSEELYDDYLSKPIDIQRFLDRIQVLLELDWVHDSADLEPEPVYFPAPVLTQAELADATNLPSRRHLDELHQLGRIGYVRGIEAKLDVIEQENDEHAAFVGHLRDLVRNFDLRSYMDALEGLRPHDS